VELVPAASAVEILIQEYGKLVFHLIYSLTGEWETSEDLTQDTFLYALRALDTAREASGEEFHARAWLLRIAVNTARMHLRRRRLIRFSSLSKLAEAQEREAEDIHVRVAAIQPVGYATQAPLDPAEQVSERDAVAQALSKLPESFRLSLLLSVVAAFSNSEIASMLNLSEVAVRQRLSRARRAFQLLYAQESCEMGSPVQGKRQQGEPPCGSHLVSRQQKQQRVKQALTLQGSVA